MPKNAEKVISLDSERLLKFERALSGQQQKIAEHNLRLTELQISVTGVKQDTANIYGILGRLETKIDGIDAKLERILARLDINDEIFP